MVASVLALWNRENESMFKYNHNSFVRSGNEWILKIKKADLVFNFFPADIENINISSGIINKLNETLEIDSTSSTNDSYKEAIALAQYGLGEVLGKISNTYIRVGTIDKNDFNLPIIDCKNATSSVPVLYFKKSNVTEVSLNDSCIIAEAKSEIDVLKIKDRLLYGILGVMQ